MSHKLKKAKKEPLRIDLDDFEFEPSGLDLKWSKNIITVLDGYRIHRCYDLTFIEKGVSEGELPKQFLRQWKIIRTVLHKFAAIGPEVPNVKKWLLRRQLIQFFSLVTFTIALPLIVLTWVLRIYDIMWFTLPFAAVGGGLVFVAWTVGAWYNRKIAWAIEHYIQENKNLLRKEKIHLKKWTQNLIWHTARIMRKEGADPEKNLIKFFNNDYNGIIVVKEPNWYRKHYTVKLKI